MKKIILLLLFLVGLTGFYVLAVNAKSDIAYQNPTPTTALSPTKLSNTCKVSTGVDGGTVNVRSCPGTSCEVLAIVTEGESLEVIEAGQWNQVTDARGWTGWLNSKYCKGK